MMNIPPSHYERRQEKRRRKWRNRRQRNKVSAIFSDYLMAEVLSYLDVKSLLKIRCLSKSLKSLISDPIFVRLHLKRSAERNPQIAIYVEDNKYGSASVVPFPISRLLQNPLNTLPTDSCYDLMGYDLVDKECHDMVGSCNGLICLQGFHRTNKASSWFCFWNPATRKVSEKLGYLRDYKHSRLSSELGYFSDCKFSRFCSFNYMFGYDNSTRTYKLVALHSLGNPLQLKVRTDVKVLSLGDNVWRNIQSLPLVPFPYATDVVGYGVDFRGSLNWLSLPSYTCKTDYEKSVISSFDLSTETYRQFLPPPSFDGSPCIPQIRVLVDCLCFSYDVERAHLLIWKMREFGVQESWTQFLNISYQNLYSGYDFCDSNNNFDCCLEPLHHSEKSDTLIFSDKLEDTAIFYNWRDNTVKRPRITQKEWWRCSQNYVESLVAPC